MAVTRRQKEIIDFLESFVSRNGYAPSFEEIARGMGLKSLATVHKHITNLEKKGLLDRVHNRSRSIEVLPPGTRNRSSDRLPLAGRIAAGLPIETVETSETISLHDVVGNAMCSPSKSAASLCAMSTSSRGTTCSLNGARTARQGEIVVALGPWLRNHSKAVLFRRAHGAIATRKHRHGAYLRSGGASLDSGTRARTLRKYR